VRRRSPGNVTAREQAGRMRALLEDASVEEALK
jgi:hypothetical protein